MGNDGGSIPTRRELVKEVARNRTTAEMKESQHEQQEYAWTTDPISQQQLAQPIVSDSSGKLYNKATILEYLVESARKEDAYKITEGALKSLKDVVEVKFDTGADVPVGSAYEAWRCPVTGDKLGPGSKAVYIVPCGHAFSGAAIKEILGEKCITCDTEYAANDVIPILPYLDTDIARLSLRVKTLQEKGLTHSLKKASTGSKKRKKKDEEVAAQLATAGEVDNGRATTRTSTPVSTVTPKHEISGINNSSAASVTAKVIEEQERAKKRKRDNATVKSLFSNRDHQSKTNTDFMTRGFSVPSGTKS